MRRLAALLLVLSLLTPPNVFGRSAASVQALAINGKNFCTAWSISAEKNLWATARHCADVVMRVQTFAMFMGDPDGVEFTLGGQKAAVLAFHPHWDLAIINSALSAPAFELAKKGPEVGDEIEIWGFPYGLPKLVKTYGRVAALGMPIEGYHVSDVLDITIAGGNSGSPVLKKVGRKYVVVGLLWGGTTQSPHALSVPYDAMQELYAYPGVR